MHERAAWLALHVAAMVTPTLRYNCPTTSGYAFWIGDGVHVVIKGKQPNALDRRLFRARWRRFKVAQIAQERGEPQEVVEAAWEMFTDDLELLGQFNRGELRGQMGAMV